MLEQERSTFGHWAETRADAAASHEGPDRLTDATGEGLAAVAFALLDIAAAIRDHADTLRAIHDESRQG